MEQPTKQSLLKNFLDFLKKPNMAQGEIETPNRKLWSIFSLWSFCIIFVLIVGLLNSLLLKLLHYDLENVIFNEFMRQNKFTLLFLLASIWAPLVEESAFRLSLRLSAKKLSFSLAIAFLFLSRVAFEKFLPDWFLSILTLSGMISFLLSLAILFLIFFALLRIKIIFNFLQRIFSSYFPFIFYSSCLIFASLHIFNYYGASRVWPIMPMLVLPQFILGILLGFVRLRFGFPYALAIHSFHNAITIAPLLILSLLAPNLTMQIINNDTLTPESISTGDSLASIFIGFLMLNFGILVLFTAIRLFARYRRQKINEKAIKQ